MERRAGKRIACIVQYDGTLFNGWQIQNSGRTVQGDIEDALKVLSGKSVRITASGRTDAGVHARGQVFHFDLPVDIPLKRICGGLNGIMDRDASVINAYQVPDDFHARYSAVEREYRYYIHNHPCSSPFALNRAMWVKEKLDLQYLENLADFCRGENDFASFCKKRESEDINTVRTIKDISFTENNSLIEIKIVGNAFLHNMIRIMVGTFVELHNNNDDPSRVKEILDKRDRIYGGKTAPPSGLYLHRIAYDPELETFDGAF
jgi:tRNA pseudouridine38-40 synthase